VESVKKQCDKSQYRAILVKKSKPTCSKTYFYKLVTILATGAWLPRIAALWGMVSEENHE